MKTRAIFRIAVLAAAAVPQVVFGQETAKPEQEAGDPGADIIVTAQRRSERLQEIPASISAIGAEQLRASGAIDISNVAPRVPGFYAGGFGASRPQLYIRGIGTRQFDPGSESSVGVFVDESYLGRTGGVLGTLKDIERVEVLKGPQGTLYGRNTIAGAVNVITKGPTSELAAEAEVGAGNYGSYDLFGAVSGPIAGDALKGRIAGWRSYRRGYMTNLSTGNHPQGLDNYGGRLRLEIDPASNVKIDLIGELMRDTGASFQGESVGNVTNPNGILLGKPTLVVPRTGDSFAQPYTSDTGYNRHVDALTAKIQIETDLADIVSITSYRKMKYFDDRDFDNTVFDVIRQISDEDSKQFSQEFRLVSNQQGALSFGGALDWIIGVYYYDDKSFHRDTFRFGADSVIGGGNVDTTFGNYWTKSLAFFGQATLKLTPTLKFTAGGRYTEDRKRADLGGTTTDTRPLVPAPFLQSNPEQTFKSFDPRFTLSWQPTRNLNLYASYGQGFKSGGYQYTPFTAAQAAQVFRPEEINAYEVGVKSVLMNGLLRANAAAYRYDYSNLQVSRVVQLPDGSTPSLITNAGKSRIEGGELDLAVIPVHNFEFDLGYAYTNARYLNYVAGPLDFSGTRMVRAPKHSLNVSAQYTAELGTDSDLTFRADLARLSSFYHEPGQGELRFGSTIPLTAEPAYSLANARLTYRTGAWKLSGWVMNLGNTKYRRTVLALPGQVINLYGQPRTWGLTLGWSL